MRRLGVAFILLCGLGLRMLHEGCSPPEDTEDSNRPLWLLALTGPISMQATLKT